MCAARSIFHQKTKKHEDPFVGNSCFSFLVRVKGVEPLRITSQDPKSCASANSAIPARKTFEIIARFFQKVKPGG